MDHVFLRMEKHVPIQVFCRESNRQKIMGKDSKEVDGYGEVTYKKRGGNVEKILLEGREWWREITMEILYSQKTQKPINRKIK